MDWLEFVLERYNYWIVIVLMMTGLYVVYARGNLVKKVVGLNLFQTSVFIFYITIGKIAGGTAPIYIGGELDHGEAGEGHGSDGADKIGHGEEAEALHAKIENGLPDNELKAGLEDLTPPSEAAPQSSIHAAPEIDPDKIANIDKPLGADPGKIANDAIAAIDKPAGEAAPETSLHVAPDVDPGKIANDALANIEKPAASGFEIEGEAGLHGADGANAIADAVHHVSEVVYTNPLPHVLILTAIVVGVATTAVGLALAVRIREAYGTIEEDELEAIDNVAEFGPEAGAAAGAAS